MSLLDFNLTASDPNNPNSVLSNPGDIARRQAIADALSKEGADYSPVGSGWQGAARLADALGGALIDRRAQSDRNLGLANNAALQAQAFGLDPGTMDAPATPGRTTPALQRSDAAIDAEFGGPPGGPSAVAAALENPAAAPSGSPAAGPSAVADALAPYRAAIAGNESGGNYQSLGPVVKSGQYAGQQALGKYGVMPGNLPEWSTAAVGRPVSAREFLANPQLQDAVFNHQFGSLLTKNSPQDAASIWLTGRPLAAGGAGAADQLGTTGQAYANKFTSQLPVAPAAAAISAAAPAPGQPAPSGAGGPMAYAADGTPVATDHQGNAVASPASGAGPTGGAYANAGAVAWKDPSTGQIITAPKGTPIPANAQIPDATMTPPGAPPSPADISQLRTAMGGAPAPAAQPSAGVVAGASPPAGPQPGSVPASPAVSPPLASGNRQALLQLLADPFTPPALAQVAEAQLAATTPTPPTFGVIGKDAAGNEQYGWISPKTQTVTPVNPANAVGGPALADPSAAPSAAAPGATSSPGGPPSPSPVVGATTPAPPNPVGQTLTGSVDMGSANGMTPQGAQYLSGLEQAGGANSVIARSARAIINGQAPLPEANAATKPIDVAIRDAVFKAAPEFNSSVAAARVDLVKQFGDKASPTSAGGMILSANAALHHLNALADSADQLGNTGFPIANFVKNEVRDKAVGNPALQSYEFNQKALADEIAKIYKGGTPAESEIKGMLSNLSPSMTPDEQKAVFSKVSTLLQGKTDELQRQWQTAFGSKSSYPVIGEEGQKIIQRFGAAPPAAPSASNGAPVKVADKASYDALPKGATYQAPDGSIRVKP